MKYLIPALRFKLFMTLLLGLIYPFAMTGISQVIFPRQASGDFLSRDGKIIIGSKLIGQNFEKPEYFWPRPSAVGFNLPSGGSNLGPTSADLKKTFEERRLKMKAAHPDQTAEPPQELLFASGSGVDPQISPEAALYQASRIAKARTMPVEQIQKMIQQMTEERQLGILGERTVNVLVLNLALDQMSQSK